MSATVQSTTPEVTTTTATTAPSTLTEINTIGGIAGAVASVVPGGQPVALGIGAAVSIADLIAHISTLYSQKVITENQLISMVATAVSGFDSAVAAWNAAPGSVA